MECQKGGTIGSTGRRVIEARKGYNVIRNTANSKIDM